MNAFFSLLEYDLTVLMRSWIVRFWFFLSIVGGVAAVVVARNFADDSSFLLAWALVLYLALGSLVILVNSVSAISLEYRFLGESIISRGIAPTPYVLAKLVSRSLGTIVMFLVILLPTSFFMMSNAQNNDLTVAGIWVGLAYWTLMLTVLTFLGITVSVLFTNTLFGLVVLGVFWYICLGLLDVAYWTEFSPEGVLGNLPLVLQGKSLIIEITTLVSLGIFPLIILPFIALKSLNNRDL